MNTTSIAKSLINSMDAKRIEGYIGGQLVERGRECSWILL